MNIALRPSGGRGEYEIAGRQGALLPHDLYHLPISIEVFPTINVPAHSHCLPKDGKSRIRLLDKSVRNSHPASLIASLLLLPKPRREKHATKGSALLVREDFVVQTIRIDISIKPASALISPVVLRLENASGAKFDLSFPERMDRVSRVWRAASGRTDRVSRAVQSHTRAFDPKTTSLKAMASSSEMVFKALGEPTGDLLPILERKYGVSVSTVLSGGVISTAITEEEFEEVVTTSSDQAKVERISKWRLAVDRNASARKFSKDVKVAYDSRCLFTGHRLPPTEASPKPGVDAAHILPWRKYDLDIVPNGICLSKHCHWAFDQGFLRLSFDKRVNAYVVSLSAPFHGAALRAGFDLAPFSGLLGPIPKSRLPKNPKQWPSPKYLADLYSFLDKP
jgi:hypothetical protein